MKRVLFLMVAAGMLAACNPEGQNNPDTPQQQQQTEFRNAKYFEVLGTSYVPSGDYTQENARAFAYITEDNSVLIEFDSITFAARMPYISMSIEGISYNREAEKITLSGDSIVPKMGSRPFAQYIITDLSGYITADSLVITNNYGSFANCRYAGKVIKIAEQAPAKDE